MLFPIDLYLLIPYFQSGAIPPRVQGSDAAGQRSCSAGANCCCQDGEQVPMGQLIQGKCVGQALGRMLQVPPSCSSDTAGLMGGEGSEAF